MKLGDIEYTSLVEKRQREIRGNVSSVKLTEAECQVEVAAITNGAVSSFAEESQPVETKKRRGRPVGSRNKPKEPK